MDAWDGWELGRAVLAFSALLYAGIWVQLTLMHWAAAFRRWEMVPPVVVTPLIVVAILIGLVARDGVLGWIAVGALAVGVVEGMAGLFFHLKGIASQVGALRSMRNYLAGPPPMLPVAYALTGVLGLIGVFWDA
ncbi:MAG: hypothetical protein WD058_00545 [Dehalococcoidia bacterium]